MTDSRTGTNLTPFEQSIANVQQELDRTNNSALGYIPPVSDKTAEVMNTIVSIGTKRKKLGDVASSYAQGKINEMPFVQNKLKQFNFTKDNLFKATPVLAAADKTVQSFEEKDWKNLILEDVSNRLKLPEQVKNELLSGAKFDSAAKNYLVDKVNASSLPVNMERQGEDSYRIFKDVALGEKATIGVSEYLNSNRPAEVRFGYNSGNFSLSADKQAGREAQATATYNFNNPEEGTQYNIAAMSRGAGGKPELRLAFRKDLKR